jgi:hypothetical protein
MAGTGDYHRNQDHGIVLAASGQIPLGPSTQEWVMSDKVVVERGEMDGLVMMRLDLDRYEAQLIPDLQQEVLALHHALRRLVEAVREAEHLLSLEATKSHRGALRDAERLLAEPRRSHEEPTAGGLGRRDARW